MGESALEVLVQGYVSMISHFGIAQGGGVAPGGLGGVVEPDACHLLIKRYKLARLQQLLPHFCCY